MNCERCNSLWASEAIFRIRTDILDLKVCRQCAKEARALGLLVESLPDAAAWTEEKVVPAAA
jgi:hypothetical protein